MQECAVDLWLSSSWSAKCLTYTSAEQIGVPSRLLSGPGSRRPFKWFQSLTKLGETCAPQFTSVGVIRTRCGVECKFPLGVVLSTTTCMPVPGEFHAVETGFAWRQSDAPPLRTGG
eukprot:1286177-Amphidinium_carterae.1